MIYKIEEFSVFDGPGIRMTVFFKGCPLRCSWCHNPEGIRFQKELMISTGLCVHCGRCMTVCSHGGVCVACGKCVDVCPLQIRKIAGEEVSTEGIAKKALENREVYESSGGGVTFSGGEPLAQPELLYDLISRLEGMHTAVETSGYVPEKVFSKAVSKLDLFIMDIKIVDTTLHKRYTGVDNALIKRNLDYLKTSGVPFWIRVPLIPGVSDTVENMWQTADLLKDAELLQRVELMPYNRSAGAKYPMVGKVFKPGFDENTAPKVSLEPFISYGINGVVL